MAGLELLLPWLVVTGLLYVLRRLERWLHQHIFKVGWLVTKKYQTTTILYYAFFLPGIFLHEFVVWLVAGFLNVRADRAVSWPEKQEIGELKLNFVKLAKNVDPIRLAVISTAPLVVGLLIVAHIANNVLDFRGFFDTMSSGFLEDFVAAFGQLTSAPDFWIWMYLTLTISNTMFPDTSKLRGWRIILTALVVVFAILFAIGAGTQVLSNAITPISNALNALSGTLTVIIIVNLIMVGILGTIEAIIERVTSDSATFKNGKMITLSREELLQQRADARTAVRTKKLAPAAAVAGGPPSIYKLILPIPGAPGKEPVTRGGDNITISPPPKPITTSPTPITRNEPAVIPGAVDKPSLPSSGTRPAISPAPNRPSLPAGTAEPAANRPAVSPPPNRLSSPAGTDEPDQPAVRNRPTLSPAPDRSVLPTGTDKPAQPAGTMRPAVAPPPSRPASPNQTDKPASPFGGNRPAVSPSSPGTDKPAQPAGTARPSILTPPSRPPLTASTAKPVDPDDDLADEFEDDDDFDDFDDDDLTYEDAEDSV